MEGVDKGNFWPSASNGDSRKGLEKVGGATEAVCKEEGGDRRNRKTGRGSSEPESVVIKAMDTYIGRQRMSVTQLQDLIMGRTAEGKTIAFWMENDSQHLRVPVVLCVAIANH